MTISYRKFDAIVDSSDDEEVEVPKKTMHLTAAAVPPEAPAPPPTPMPVMPPSSPMKHESFGQQFSVAADPLGRAAVCSTMKDVCGRIDSWVRWHLFLGFSRLYIFFDDATESASIEAARAAGGTAVVTLLRGSASLRAAWSRQPSWASMGADADHDVQIRQLLNAQLAMELARADGLTWLLHLDSDELFLPRTAAAEAPGRTVAEPACEAGAAATLLASLGAAGCECFVFHNFESVPTRVAEPSAAAALPVPPPGGPPTDPFTTIDLFKHCETRVEWRTQPEAARALEQWRSRSLAGKFFLYYENGKCACRVDTDGQWVPVNVHLCLPRSAEGKWDSDRLLRCGWTNDVRNSGLRHHTAEASAVLHYPLWDPEALWRKYVLHGEFANELPSVDAAA